VTGSLGAAAREAVLPDDNELVAALKRGDEATFATLVDAWSPGLMRMAADVRA